MENLERQLLLRDLGELGYPLVEQSHAQVEETLLKAIQSSEIRFLEGVPVVISNLLSRGTSLDFFKLEKTLPGRLQRRFRIFCAITYLFLFWLPDSQTLRLELFEYLKEREPSLMDQIQFKLSQFQPIPIGDKIVLDSERLQKIYKNYVIAQISDQDKNMNEKLEKQRTDAFFDALHHLFTERQSSLLMKILNKEVMSKTEKEYFSRTIKPRLKAVTNPDLQAFASSILGQ